MRYDLLHLGKFLLLAAFSGHFHVKPISPATPLHEHEAVSSYSPGSLRRDKRYPEKSRRGLPTRTLTPLRVAERGISSLQGQRQTRGRRKHDVRVSPSIVAHSWSTGFSAIAKSVTPSVVSIELETGGTGSSRRPIELPASWQTSTQGQPSPSFNSDIHIAAGLVWDAHGTVVTNSHIIGDTTKFSITFGDTPIRCLGRLLSRDRQADIAILRVDEGCGRPYFPVRLGDSDRLEVGAWVLAIGAPLGLDNTVTAGIVSARGNRRRPARLGGRVVGDFIQTDADLNPGSAGGPLCDLNGFVVGVNSLIEIANGGSYGFALPINDIKKAVKILLRRGRIAHPYLGIVFLDVAPGHGTPPIQKPTGCSSKGLYVSDVLAGSPAWKSGVRPGDRLGAIDGRRISEASDVVSYVASREVGDKVVVSRERNCQVQSIRVRLDDLPRDLEK